MVRRHAHLRHTESDEDRPGYLDAIADVGARVELFAPTAHSPDLSRFQSILAEYDLEIASVHGPHLQPMLDDRDPGMFLRTVVRGEHLASVIDRFPDRAITPDVSTHHPPRLWPDDDRSLADARYAFLRGYCDALPTLEPTHDDLPPAFDGSLITATVALENVAPRTSHRYMLRTPGDATAMRDAATACGHADRLAFTCDVGHARDPAAMLAAMESVVNVHLHSTVSVGDRAAARIRDRYGIDDPDRLGEFDRPGRAHHLPPHVGDLDVPAVLDALDDHGYEGPLTVELAAPYRSADVVHETVDALDIYR